MTRRPRFFCRPTRRSSDLLVLEAGRRPAPAAQQGVEVIRQAHRPNYFNTDRKSTRLNSSHQIISYAVFCLKKKKKKHKTTHKNNTKHPTTSNMNRKTTQKL